MHDLSSAERPTSVRLGVLGFLAAMTFVLYLDRLCIGQAAPLIQQELGISDTWMGVVFSAFSLSYVLFEIPTGRWGDRFGSRGVLARIVVWWSCFTALTGAASGLAMLLVIRFLFGAGEAGALPNSARVLKAWFPESTRGKAQGIITTAMMAGGAVAPPISQALINALGWRGTFASFGLLGLTWAVLFYLWFRDDPNQHPAVNDAERRLIAEGRPKPAGAGVSAALDGGDEIGGGNAHAHAHEPIPWRRTLTNPNIWLLGVAMLTMSGIYTMLGSWYPKYLQAARGATANDSSWLSSMVLGAGAAGCLLGGALTDHLVKVTGSRRWGRTAQSVAGAGLTAACLFASLRTDSVLLASVLVAIACFGVQIQVPAWWASATEVGGRHVGALFGLMNMVGNVGGIVSPIFLGRFVDVMKARGYTGRDQWDPGLFVYVVVAILGMILWGLVDPTRGVDGEKGQGRPDMERERPVVMTVFGTRPELIKLAPVVRALEAFSPSLRVVTVNTGQHRDLLVPFLDTFRVRVDHGLDVMTSGQTPNQVCARILAAIDPILDAERPAIVLVQGDTTTALAGALAAFHRGIPVGHVEAGLRSGDRANPFPEEMNRRLISRLASHHFAATERNRATLLAEGIAAESVVVTGNPIVDALRAIRGEEGPSDSLQLRSILNATCGLGRIVLTTHRRESFGGALEANLRVLRDFIARRDDLCLIFPVHPNPEVRKQAATILAGHPRVHLVEPLDYAGFLGLLSHATLIVSDSGGIQEEAPSLGKPVLVLRENTERPESIEAGFAKLTRADPAELARLLDEACSPGSWVEALHAVGSASTNPYGDGDAGPRIARAVAEILGVLVTVLPPTIDRALRSPPPFAGEG